MLISLTNLNLICQTLQPATVQELKDRYQIQFFALDFHFLIPMTRVGVCSLYHRMCLKNRQALSTVT